MRTFELTYPHSLILEELPETVCAIGFFDGIHKGHQRVIQTAVNKAKEHGMESAVITFHPHPSVVLRKGTHEVKYITPLKEKIELLQNMDVDRLYIITFNEQLSKLSPQEFIDHFIIGLHIKCLVAGFDYTFGYKGSGNMNNINQYTRGKLKTYTIEKVVMDEEKVSSTRIRKLLDEGKVHEVNKLLGRPFRLCGVVIHGDHRGKKLGFPTANLEVDEDAFIPKPGVYAVKVCYKQESYEGMASIGTNPTFTEDRKELSVEVNILDYNNNLYGEELCIEWHQYIRDEVKFTSAVELIDQMKKDEINIRNFFSQ